MGSSILVSVIIPVYNVEAYLEECVDSVLGQSYKNLEIILVDDGSKDNSPFICDKYVEKDNRIKVIHKENGGLSDARNTGLNASCGKYIYFLDSDDYIDKNSIKYLVEKAEDTNADVVFFDAKIIYEKSNSCDEETYVRKGNYSNATNGSKAFFMLNENSEFFTAVPLLFIKKEKLIEKNVVFYKGILHEDELFTFELFMCSDVVVYIPMTLYYRRVRDGSIMTSKVKLKNYTSLLTVFEETLKLYDNEQDMERKNIIAIQLINLFKIAYYKYNLLSRKDKKKVNENKKQFYNRIHHYNYFENKEIYKICHMSKFHNFAIKVIRLLKIEKFIIEKKGLVK